MSSRDACSDANLATLSFQTHLATFSLEDFDARESVANWFSQGQGS